MQVSGTIVVVTGSGHGTGEGLARRFLEEARMVVVSDLDGASTGRVGEELGQPHRVCDDAWLERTTTRIQPMKQLGPWD